MQKYIFSFFKESKKAKQNFTEFVSFFGIIFFFIVWQSKEYYVEFVLKKNCSKNFYFDVCQFPFISDKNFCFKL